MRKIAICDDNPEFLATVTEAIRRWDDRPEGLEVRCYTDGDALIDAHRMDVFDVILLDVVMPLINGIDTAREIRTWDKRVKIVFLTSSSEFAVDSYRVKAYNYLLKPLQPEELYQCLDELLAEEEHSTRSIAVRDAGGTHQIELQSIEYLEAQNKHTILSLTDGSTLESTDPLSLYEEKLMLSDGFYRCHRSYIVNIFHIESYTSSEIKTQCGYRIPVARSVQKKFESTYFSVLFGRVGDR